MRARRARTARTGPAKGSGAGDGGDAWVLAEVEAALAEEEESAIDPESLADAQSERPSPNASASDVTPPGRDEPDEPPR